MLAFTDWQAPPDQVNALPATLDWRPLHLFNFYRFTVALTFTTTVILGVAPSFLGESNPKVFIITGLSYCAFAIFCFFTILRRWPSFNIQVLSQVLVDIFTITVLMHASGGVGSGLGLLLAVVVAGGSLLTEGRTAIFFAAVASLAVLIHVALADIYDWFYVTNYTHASMLGTAFFATAVLAYVLAKRARASEALAKQRGVHLQYLSQLNAQIVQHIQSGIVVVNVVGRVRLINEAARRLLGLGGEQPNGRTLIAVAPELSKLLTQWQNNEGDLPTPLLFSPTTGEVDVIATFTELDRAGSVSVLIVLEDATLMNQRAQQLKLASLGRLTASIAHEIRNPLSAISHAGQLLAESPDLPAADMRLTKIIATHSQRVNTIIENVLQLSRREPPKTERFDLYVWLREFVEDFLIQKNLEADDVVIQALHTPIMVCFDPVQLYQVITNVCENALRYSKGKPLLELTLSGELAKPCLDVRDYGPGMLEEVASQVFEPFFTTQSHGTGLGLYIAKEICQANQASLHLILNTTAGCCFRIHFTDEV